MPPDLTTNNATAYRNINACRSFVQAISTVLIPLSAQTCSEAIIINKTGQPLYVYDGGYVADTNRILLDTNESIVLRGLTNTSEISAKTALSGSGNLYYRTQNYSLLAQV